MDLLSRITERIRQSGPITLAEYMHMALYDAKEGYYRRREAIGESGDFITAPEISQLFGEMIGIWLVTFWQQLGSPSSVAIVELGPGRGTLMQDILRVVSKNDYFRKSASIHLIEVSETLKAIQKANLDHLDIPMHWHSSVDDLPEKPCFVVANEFFDALPIHQLTHTPQGWEETLVSLNARGDLTLQPGPISDAAAHTLPDKLASATYEDGAVVEFSPLTLQIARTLSQHCADHGGGGLIIDYGYAALPSSGGDSFQAIHDHQFYPPLESPGKADLTAHVSFPQLVDNLRHVGVTSFGPVSQGVFLNRLGIRLRGQRLSGTANDKERKRISSAIHRLTHPSAMGNLFKCLAYGPSGSLTPFAMEPDSAL